jgi:hypothetical protein
MIGAPGFFVFDDRLKRLSDLGDQLEAFQKAVDFEMFRADLVAALAYTSGPQGGRPPRLGASAPTARERARRLADFR